MLNDDDNAGVLNAVAAVQNGGAATDMVEKNRAGGEDNWLDADDHDEYYPSRDHFSDLQNLHMPFWDSYDSINQLYLEIGRYPHQRVGVNGGGRKRSKRNIKKGGGLIGDK